MAHSLNRWMWCVFAAVAALAGAIPASLLAQNISIVANRDNTLYLDGVGATSNGAGSYIFVGTSNSFEPRRGLVSFDLSAIPPGSQINSVSLSLYMSRTVAGAQPVSLHRTLASWGEGTSNAGGQEGQGAAATVGDATWLHRIFNTQFWMNPGGDFNPVSSASTSVNDNGFYTWTSPSMVADVQGWLTNSTSNHGWMIIGNESAQRTAKRFESRESGTPSRRPTLTINYTPGVFPVGACCRPDGGCSLTTAGGCADQGGTYGGNGSSCSPNPCPQPPTGACCLPDGSCITTTEGICALQNGLYQGDGASCSPNPCPQPPTGACCLPFGACIITSSFACAAQGGSYLGDNVSCSPTPCPPMLTPFVDALPIPPIAQPTSGVPGGAAHYDIFITRFQQRLHRDLPLTTLYGYDGQYPGPTIEARSGQTVTVRWINDLRDDNDALLTQHDLVVDECLHGPDMNGSVPRTVTHLHGGRVPADSDGYPEATFAPGESSNIYTYPNQQRAATNWYHDHALGLTRLNVYMGLAGAYLLRDAAEDALNIPRGQYEIPLIVQDRALWSDGALRYEADWRDQFFGDFILVNGKVWPYLEVHRGKYRFRIVNGSNSRSYTFALSNGQPFVLIGTDGGLRTTPLSLTSLTLTPGERGDVIIDFALLPAGTEIFLTNSAPAPFPGDPGEGVVPDVMKFIVTSTAGDTDPIPFSLSTILSIPPSEAIIERTLVLQQGGAHDCGNGPMWTINGLLWDDITEYPRLGTTEIWSWVNRSGESHPMHLHLVSFQLLNRQDFTVIDDQVIPLGPVIPVPLSESGWKDTIQATPNQITRVIMRIEGYPGTYPYHCHVLEHEDHEMMRQFVARPRCSGDANDDGFVDFADITTILSNFGTAGPRGQPGDSNLDGAVNFTDVSETLGQFSSSCH